MSDIFLLLAGLIILANSGLMLFTSSKTYESLIENYPAINFSFFLMGFGLLVIIPSQFGEIAREEISAIPWEVWFQKSGRHGYSSGVLAVVINLIYLLWVFFIPGHLYANWIYNKNKDRPISPYIINVLAGVILCIPSNPVYRIIETLFFGIFRR